jgi:hypothetical protein
MRVVTANAIVIAIVTIVDVVIIVVGVTVLVLMRSPILPSLSLSRPCTHVNSSSEAHARLHHVGWDVARVPIDVQKQKKRGEVIRRRRVRSYDSNG